MNNKEKDEYDTELEKLNKKIDVLTGYFKDQDYIKLHPTVFLILLIGVFIMFDLWSETVKAFFTTILPNNKLGLLEYFLIALGATILILYIDKKLGLSINLFS